jgi:Tol biopolymer transport system component
MVAGKSLVLVVSLFLALGPLAGCGGKKEEGAKSQKESVAAGEQAQETTSETEAARAETAQPGEGGSFYVESFPPGAEIVVNGVKAAGRTPYLFNDRKPGHYEILVVLPGYTPTPNMHEVDVTAGSLDTLSFKMEGEPLSTFILMQKDAKEVRPKWSPKGDMIAYEAYYDNNRDIYLIPAAGGDPVRLTFAKEADFAPCWSPDAKEIAFVSAREGTVDLWVVNASGGEPRRIASLPAAEDNPAWSPDGKWIAFEYKGKIWKIRPSGEDAQAVTSGEGRHFEPTWSPDGKEIAFSARVGDGRQLWVANVATGAIRKILADKGWSYAPNWSPNGKIIAFTRRGGLPEQNHDLYVISASGSEVTQITLDPLPDQFPCFSPDGKEIVFTRNADLYVMTNLPGWLYQGS